MAAVDACHIGRRTCDRGGDEAARHGLSIVPVCLDASSWLRKHPDVAARVTPNG